MYGEDACATAIASPDGENATPKPSPVAGVTGLAYLAPPPVELQEKAFTYGDMFTPTATTLLLGVDAESILYIIMRYPLARRSLQPQPSKVRQLYNRSG